MEKFKGLRRVVYAIGMVGEILDEIYIEGDKRKDRIMSDFKGACELPITIIAALREIAKRHGNMAYDDCDKIAADVMRAKFEEFAEAPESKLLDVVGHIEDMTKGATLLSELRDAL